jgi:hypothetical protein
MSNQCHAHKIYAGYHFGICNTKQEKFSTEYHLYFYGIRLNSSGIYRYFSECCLNTMWVAVRISYQFVSWWCTIHIDCAGV